ncbi:MAG: hypothetical protein R3B71_04050 [Candidatus Gracilibacteria bacterium]
MDKKKKILILVLVVLGLAAIVLAYFLDNGELFQGYLRYQYSAPATSTTQLRLNTGKTVDSAQDDEPAFGETITTRETDNTSSGTFTRID